MLVKGNKSNGKIEIDLRGPEGNAYYLLGLANKIGRRLGMSAEKIEEIQFNMRMTDYEMLVKVFHRYFGDYIIIYNADVLDSYKDK